jgi:hypothetical protein
MKMKSPPYLYWRKDGALMAVCPERVWDVNVHVWCWQCRSEECPLAGKTVTELKEEVKQA